MRFPQYAGSQGRGLHGGAYPDGNMGEELEAKVWEKRMTGLTPAEQLAVEIDRFTYDYDAALYHDNSQSMTENVSELADALNQRDTHDIALWLAEIAADGTEPEERKRAVELLEKLAEYKPLAKIEYSRNALRQRLP